MHALMANYRRTLCQGHGHTEPCHAMMSCHKILSVRLGVEDENSVEDEGNQQKRKDISMASMVMSKLRDKRVVIDFYARCHCSRLASSSTTREEETKMVYDVPKIVNPSELGTV